MRDLTTTWDLETRVALTPRFTAALIELMRAECEMMSAVDGHAECWTWGRCRVSDLASSMALSFEYGGDHDPPDDGLGAFGVLLDDTPAHPGEGSGSDGG